MSAYPRGRRFPALLAGAVLLTGVIAVASYAGHAAVASYTACLNTGGKSLYNVAVGDSPSSACKAGHATVHFSGGDITAVNAGTGLTGGAASGEASLDVDFTAFGTCPAGSAIRTVGTSATCETDDDTTYTAGSGLDLAGMSFSVDTSAVQARVDGTCEVGRAIREIAADGTVTCEAIPEAEVPGELILVQRHEFDMNEVWFTNGDVIGQADWEIIETGSGLVQIDPAYEPAYHNVSAVTMNTVGGTSSAVVHGTRQASIGGGTLVFKAEVIDAYAEAGAVYGDRQPRGLANGSDRSDAIEFVNVTGFTSGGLNTGTACRTVNDGTVTETAVNIDQWVRTPAVYQIVATAAEARFYVNGVLECTHTTNIPDEPLNIYFGTSSTVGNVPLTVDWVSYERRDG